MGSQPKGKKDELDVLKKENKELRRTVAQLTKQLRQQEESANERHQELMAKILSTRPKPTEEERTTSNKPMDQIPGPSKRPDPENDQEEDKGFQVVKPKRRPAKRTADEGNKRTETPKDPVTQPPKPARIPLVLRKQDKWGEISKLLGQRNVAVTKARLRRGMIETEPATADDHRSLTKLLAERTKEYHTYTLPEEKSVRYVIKGIPTGIPDEEIMEELPGRDSKYNRWRG